MTIDERAALVAEATAALDRAKADIGYTGCAAWAINYGPKIIAALCAPSLDAAPASPVGVEIQPDKSNLIDYFDLTLDDVKRAVRSWWNNTNPHYEPDRHDMGRMADALNAALAGRKLRHVDTHPDPDWALTAFMYDGWEERAKLKATELGFSSVLEALSIIQPLRDECAFWFAQFKARPPSPSTSTPG